MVQLLLELKFGIIIHLGMNGTIAAYSNTKATSSTTTINIDNIFAHNGNTTAAPQSKQNPIFTYLQSMYY